MKKLVTLLFTFALAFTLSMPVFAQDTGASQEQTQTAPQAGKKKSHKLSLHKGSKKSKKEAKEEKKETKGEENPKQ